MGMTLEHISDYKAHAMTYINIFHGVEIKMKKNKNRMNTGSTIFFNIFKGGLINFENPS